MEKNERIEACSSYGGEERYIQNFGVETLRKDINWGTQAYMGG